LELGLRKRFTINTKHRIFVGLHYTFIQTETQNEEPSKYISNHPAHLANVILRYATKFVDLNINSTYRQRTPEVNEAVFGEIPETYLITNASIRLKLMKGKMGLLAKALNIFDTEYQEILGSPMPRRWFAAGVDWKL